MIEVKFYEEVKDENEETFGFLYLAEVKEFEKELYNEIEEIVLLDDFPDNCTYPDIQPKLFEKITESTNEHDDCKSFDPFSRFHEAGRRLPDGAGRRGADAALRCDGRPFRAQHQLWCAGAEEPAQGDARGLLRCAPDDQPPAGLCRAVCKGGGHAAEFPSGM